jgi:hypothetical protein
MHADLGAIDWDGTLRSEGKLSSRREMAWEVHEAQGTC